MNKPKLTYLEWCDAMDGMPNWTPVEEAIEWAKSTDWIIYQCGFIIHEDEEFILMAGKWNPHYSHEDSPDMVSEVTKIPKTWIMVRHEIKLPNQKKKKE